MSCIRRNCPHLLVAIPSPLMRIFTDNSEIITLGAYGLKIIGISFLFAPFPIITAVMYQAVGKRQSNIPLCGEFAVPSSFVGRYAKSFRNGRYMVVVCNIDVLFGGSFHSFNTFGL
jgi:hypothetical protein